MQNIVTSNVHLKYLDITSKVYVIVKEYMTAGFTHNAII